MFSHVRLLAGIPLVFFLQQMMYFMICFHVEICFSSNKINIKFINVVEEQNEGITCNLLFPEQSALEREILSLQTSLLENFALPLVYY